MEYPITQENESVLTFHYQPDYSAGCLFIFAAIFFIATAIFATVHSRLQDFWMIIACAPPPLLIGIWCLISPREVYCTIDKSSKKILYNKGGVFGFSIGARTTEYDFSDITELEMKKTIDRYPAYSIRLILASGGKLDLFRRKFDYDECYALVKQIREFLGDELPMDQDDRSFKYKNL